MLEAKVTWVSLPKESKHGGYYRLVTLRILTGEERQARVFVDSKCRNHKKWEPVLEKDNIIGGLVWKNEEKGVIDADSPVHLL